VTGGSGSGSTHYRAIGYAPWGCRQWLQFLAPDGSRRRAVGSGADVPGSEPQAQSSRVEWRTLRLARKFKMRQSLGAACYPATRAGSFEPERGACHQRVVWEVVQ
jgi:hypothetical protein